MKKSITRIFTIAACAAMMLTAAPVANVQAAATSQGTINLATQKLVIKNGTSTAMASKTVTMVKARRYQVKAKFGSTTVTTKGTYKSSKTSVATVSGTGLVTAKAPGTATISVTYGGTKQTFKVKVVASHTHSWKTTAKATCAAKEKRLCRTCGVVGSTAKKTTHTWKTTQKATCYEGGRKKCTVCGKTENVARAAHKYVTEEWTGVEGRGKVSHVDTVYCNGCGIDMTSWSRDKINAHYTDIDAMLAGTANMDCFGAGYNAIHGESRYPKYMMTTIKDKYCKTCGMQEASVVKDLYEVYYDEWKNVVRKSDNKIIEESNAYKAYKPYLEAAKKAAASNAAPQAKTAPKAATASVATFSLMNDEVPVEDVVVADENIMVAGEAIEAEEAVVPADEVLVEDAETVSGNEAVSENNITDLETGSDVSFGKADTEAGDDGIMVTSLDEEDGIEIAGPESEKTDEAGDIAIVSGNDIAVDGTDAGKTTIVSANSAIEDKPVYIEKTVISGNDIILTNELVSDSKLVATNKKTNGNFVALLSHAVVDNNVEEPEEKEVVTVEEDDEDKIVTEDDEEGEIVPEDE